ncbi:MAG: ATP synthase F1 subunit delta [Alphaproteobacteria bacterium]|nr:ATP synthase F1 subunit delta [Alphaproteobacteria bacterium]
MAQGKESTTKAKAAEGDRPNMAEGGSLVVRRYAIALCDLAEDHKATAVISADIEKISQTLHRVPEFAQFIENPTLTAEQQRTVLNAIVVELKLHDLTRRLIGVLVENARVGMIPDLIRAYHIELQKRQGAQTAVVTSSHALTAAQSSELLARLQSKYGKGIGLQQRIDSSLIGGLSVEVGTVLIDYSLKSKLARLEQVMKGAV